MVEEFVMFNMGEFIRLYAKTSIFTLLTGLVFGFLGSNMFAVLPLITVMTVLVLAFGMYTGCWLGFEYKMKAYLLGGFLLVAYGIEVILSHICNLI